MPAITALAGRVLRSTHTVRCAHCRCDNGPGMAFCQVCGTVLGGSKCPRCEAVNPSHMTACGLCGYTLPQKGSPAPPPVDVFQSVAPRPTVPHEEPSPSALIGFGGVLSLAAAAYPWYVFGPIEIGPEQQATIIHLLEAGWRGFPGVPLALIAVAAVTSTTVSVIRELEALRPVVAVVSGLVSLLSALWLSQGLERALPSGAGPMMPATGAVLVTIGAIIVLTAGLSLWSRLRAEPSSQASLDPSPRTLAPLAVAPAA